jgi:hypothetical protein
MNTYNAIDAMMSAHLDMARDYQGTKDRYKFYERRNRQYWTFRQRIIRDIEKMKIAAANTVALPSALESAMMAALAKLADRNNYSVRDYDPHTRMTEEFDPGEPYDIWWKPIEDEAIYAPWEYARCVLEKLEEV